MFGGRMNLQVCTDCNKPKPLNEFYYSENNLRGYSTICLECISNRKKCISLPKGVHCAWCDRPLSGKQRMFCSPDCGICYRSGGIPYRARGWYWSDEEKRIVKPDMEKPVKIVSPTKKEKKPKPIQESHPRYYGTVYLMEAENGFHKIGITRNIESRLDGLNREIPVSVRCVHHILSNHYREAEKYMHTKFSNERVRYEWFKLSKEQIDWICSLKDYEIDMLLDQ
jgi:hypothetical protein